MLQLSPSFSKTPSTGPLRPSVHFYTPPSTARQRHNLPGPSCKMLNYRLFHCQIQESTHYAFSVGISASQPPPKHLSNAPNRPFESMPCRDHTHTDSNNHRESVILRKTIVQKFRTNTLAENESNTPVDGKKYMVQGRSKRRRRGLCAKARTRWVSEVSLDC